MTDIGDTATPRHVVSIDRSPRRVLAVRLSNTGNAVMNPTHAYYSSTADNYKEGRVSTCSPCVNAAADGVPLDASSV